MTFSIFGSRVLFWMLAPWLTLCIPMFTYQAITCAREDNLGGTLICAVLVLCCLSGLLIGISVRRFGWSGIFITLASLRHTSRLRDPVEALQWDAARKLLDLGVTVILENGFWTREERAKYQSQAKALGARVELHYLDVPKEELWLRIVKRNAELPEDSFRITREEFDSWWPWFQAPDADELKTYDDYRA